MSSVYLMESWMQILDRVHRSLMYLAQYSNSVVDPCLFVWIMENVIKQVWLVIYLVNIGAFLFQ